jgi:phenylpyruvate tautomerase PptA (4-oxalocrotonate tautomerase family)
MSVTVIPEAFKFVSFDAALIARITEGLASALGLADQAIRVEVDETTPLARVTIDYGSADDPTVVIRAESGAFEDTRRPREQSENATAHSIGRALLRVRDRLAGGFGEAPPDDALTLAQTAAWETYNVGRLERFGVPVNQQRWRYNFRNRHGFTDRADEAFDRLWASDGLTWGELCTISESASTAGVG